MFDLETLQSILEAVASGAITPTVACEQLKLANFQAVEDFAKIDYQRQERTGFPEVIWGQDKTPEQIIKIFKVSKSQSGLVMATRINCEVFEQLKIALPQLQYYPKARICALGKLLKAPELGGTITILTAGTSDIPVAEEGAVTAELLGFKVQRLWDVGVAGIHRLLSYRHLLDRADVLIVVAGMEGALPSVVGGLANCPIIAVPTSIGYGANFNGIAPLLTMINSCAPGVGVVNIDNGFGAAILAGQILRTATKLSSTPPLLKQGDSLQKNWQWVYRNQIDGENQGDRATLINAIRQGARVRLVLNLGSRSELAIEAQTLWIEGDTVFTQTRLEGNFTGLQASLGLKKIANYLILSTNTIGELELISSPEQERVKTSKIAIDWFMS